jgi:hypothetical protein
MREHSTPASLSPSAQPLLTTFLSMLLACRPVCRQARPFQRFVALALAQVVTLGRHTLTQLLATLGLMGDWSAFYRLFSVPRLAPERLRAQVLAETLALIPPAQPFVAVLDEVQVPRHSRTMPGSSYLHNPASPPFKRGIHRAQRFVDLAALLPRSASGYSRAVPLEWRPAIPAKGVRPEDVPPAKSWAVGMEQLAWLRAGLDAAGRAAQLLLAVADRGWQGAPTWNALPERTALLARCQRNRVLFARPPAPNGKPGRPRLYGERAASPAEWLHVDEGWQATALLVRGRSIPLTYRVEGPYLVRKAPEQPLFLLVVRGSGPGRGKKRRQPAFWLVSAVDEDGQWVLPLPAEELLAWAWQRWEIEVTHREAKTGFGVGQVQCWSQVSALLAVQWQVLVYSLLILAGYRCWGLSPGPLRPPGTWWRGSGRWSLDQLVQALRRELGAVAAYRPVWTRMTGEWWEMADWMDLQTNALQAAGHL